MTWTHCSEILPLVQLYIDMLHEIYEFCFLERYKPTIIITG